MTSKQSETARLFVRRANLKLAQELLAALARNQADRQTLRRRVRTLLRRVEREGV